MVDKHHETQEQSIKARKHQLFEADEPSAVGSGRPFKAFLRETPAAPLSGLTKLILWAAGAVVTLVLVAALAKTFLRHSQYPPRPARAAGLGPAAPPTPTPSPSPKPSAPPTETPGSRSPTAPPSPSPTDGPPKKPSTQKRSSKKGSGQARPSPR